MTAPLRFTIIIAVRNGAKTLQRALDGVFEQTYEHVELIIMDGASTDQTTKILERNSSRISYWESKLDRGIYHAWNKALDHATGDWICFLGSDDRFHAPDVLTRMATALAGHSDRYGVAYASVRVIRDDGSVDRCAGEPWEEARDAFGRGVMIPHPATFHHRELFERHGRFNEDFRIAGDYEFLLRELLDADPIFVPDLIAVDLGAGGVSDRPSSSYVVLREVYRARYMHGLETVPGWRSGPLNRAILGIWIRRTFGHRIAELVQRVYRIVTRKPRQQR